MLFNSFEFIMFLPVVFCLYWLLCNYRNQQNILVIVASYIFYGWWDWRFLILIAFTSLCSFVAGIMIAHYKSVQPNMAKLVSYANIVLNILILGVFKYYNFFSDNFAIILRELGFDVDMVTLRVILPVGISFYTFQALSYSIDVYRGKIEATKDLPAFLAFISFFPQLVAGPIERATNLLPQFLKNRKFEYEMAVDGTKQMLWGFFKKMVVADNCANVVNDIFTHYKEYNPLILIGGGILFAFQIYGDFSGYSDIAIGVSKLFGIRLKRNFVVPYFSRNMAEFWKRWHISLNTWFVDYIYIPLGGSRDGMWKTFRNTMIIFAISGLWHGANWTFIVWGIYHGLLFLPLLLLGTTKKYNKSEASMRDIPQILMTFVLVVIGWIIFRADNITEAYEYILHIFTPASWMCRISGIEKFVVPMIWICSLLVIEWLTRSSEHNFRIFMGEMPCVIKVFEKKLSNSVIVRWSIYLIVSLIILCFSGKQAGFIYFQF